jgi:pimeloyl-ACP methyl ester carboxylesterase
VIPLRPSIQLIEHSPPAHRHVLGVRGVDVHWAEMGTGPPVVLLHGLGDSHRTWSKVAPLLAPHRRVLMPDLPGHGFSGRPDASYALEWHAEIIGTWLVALGLESVELVGHSFGGGVAQWLLLDHRARVRRLALVSAGGLGRDVTVGLRLASISSAIESFGQPLMGVGTRLAMRMFDGSFGPDEVDDLAWLNCQPGSARAFARTVRDVIDWRGQRRRIWDGADRVHELPPTAVFWGTSDPIIPAQHGTDLTTLVDGIELHKFEGCGHYPHREVPDAFVTGLLGFLQDPSVRPARVKRALLRTDGRRARALSRMRAWASGVRFRGKMPKVAGATR